MDFGLTEEQEMIVSTVRSFVEKEIYPHEAEVERTGQVPHELGEAIKQKVIDLGFYACNFPEEVGGAGLSHVDFTLVERELGRGSMALTHFFGRPQNILMACNDDQKERYLLPAVRGERMDALAMTEPDAGSDVRGMKCTAVRDGGDWVVNGSKHFISGAEHADFFIVFIATGVDETPKGPKKRITTFLVDRGTPGFEVQPPYRKMGWHASDTHGLTFTDCRVPAENLLGERGRGFANFLAILDDGRVAIAAMAVGVIEACVSQSVQYAKDRHAFGKPIGSYQAVAFKCADLAVMAEQARNLTYHAAWLKDQGRPFKQEAAMAKLYATEAAVTATREATQIFGGYGFIDETPVARHYRDAKILEIGEGTSEVQRMIIARGLGLPL